MWRECASELSFSLAPSSSPSGSPATTFQNTDLKSDRVSSCFMQVHCNSFSLDPLFHLRSSTPSLNKATLTLWAFLWPPAWKPVLSGIDGWPAPPYLLGLERLAKLLLRALTLLLLSWRFPLRRPWAALQPSSGASPRLPCAAQQLPGCLPAFSFFRSLLLTAGHCAAESPLLYSA